MAAMAAMAELLPAILPYSDAEAKEKSPLGFVPKGLD
jgi:hypothetical protein